jgi:5-methylcytosine-specific restriction protein B
MAVSRHENGLAALATMIRSGLPAPDGGARQILSDLFGGRYLQRYFKSTVVRDAFSLSSGETDEGVPFAGLIHPDNPPSGAYGGTSVVWFPTKDAGSLLGLLVGTRGLSPDEGILTRPGHRRRIAALRRYLSRLGVECWTKPDPSALSVTVPGSVQARFPGFERAFRRYPREMYCIARVPFEPEPAREVVQAFFDLYAYERGWSVLKQHEGDYAALHGALRADLFPTVTCAQVQALLRQRRFVILQGPPGPARPGWPSKCATSSLPDME